MRPPAFWARDGGLPRLLSPASAVVARVTARRMTRPGWQAPVPVLCVGNAGVGGAGKTTVVLDLARRLVAHGVAVHCLTRGYGGRVDGTMRVDPARNRAALVGDEPLLLAAVAPTWVGRDRAASARAAIVAGAQALLMDDGLQNPGLAKTSSLLVIDGAVGFGNGRVLPAGPLRETAAAAAARCRAGVMIGEDRTGAARALAGLPVLEASLVPVMRLDGAPVFAFCGIARPTKFFDTLIAAGGVILGRMAFADHHPFSSGEVDRIMAAAARLGARPITTAKDAVRLPAEVRARVDVFEIRLAWRDPSQIERMLADVIG